MRRRRSSRSEVEVCFQVLEWPAEVCWGGSLFIAPDERFKMTWLRVGQVYLIKDGYISFWRVQILLKLTMSQIYPTEVRYVLLDPTAMALEPNWELDRSSRSDMSYEGRICPTKPDCNDSGTRPGARYARCIGYVWPGTNAKALELDGNIRSSRICPIQHRQN
jgi:hypothetical protein